ncbi:MAG: cyclic nucleotide-binding domain-containing protein [Candidatus Eremiobacteraeota bacterium]|nr:cyclic nucleotide-binding domain-containing protein [Candidatus Eremiobacteraeota bacterium]
MTEKPKGRKKAVPGSSRKGSPHPVSFEGLEDIKEVLDKIGLFKDLDPALQRELLSYMKIERYNAGQVIFNEKDPGDRIYIVDYGQVAIMKSIDWGRGRELIIDYCDPGDFFGEMAVFENARRSARAETTEGSQLLVIDGSRFVELLQAHPEAFTKILFSMIRIQSNRLRANHMKLITFYEIGNVLSGEKPIEEQALKILDTLLVSLELKDGALLVYNPFSQLMEFEALHGVTPVNPEARGVPLTGVMKQVMEKGLTTAIDGSFIDETLKFILGTGNIPSWLLIAPMKVEQEPIGFIFLLKKDDFIPFNKSEILLTSAIAKQVSLEVKTSRIKEEHTAREKFRRMYFKSVI